MLNLSDFIEKHHSVRTTSSNFIIRLYSSASRCILSFVQNPVTGEPMTLRDIIRLKMAKNAEGEWHCPVTFKVFNNHSAVVAIRTSGNVYAAEAVNELNVKAKNFVDLLTGEPFKKSDIIVLQDPSDSTVSARRDISNFEHLKRLRADAAASRSSEGSVRHNPTTQEMVAEVERLRKKEEEAPTAKSNPALLSSRSSVKELTIDVDEFLAMRPTTHDVNPGRSITDQRAGGSFTSTAQDVYTSSSTRLATPDEIREARYSKMREVR
jgi:peptidyl-prolyl cis-trans isomerase-like protein 2